MAVFSKAVAEEGLMLGNPFENLNIPQEGQDAKKREAYTVSELFIIAGDCRRLDDDIRHIIALQIDTGAKRGGGKKLEAGLPPPQPTRPAVRRAMLNSLDRHLTRCPHCDRLIHRASSS